MKGHNAYGSPQLPYVEDSLDGLVQLVEFAGVARPHQLQAVARNGEYVVDSQEPLRLGADGPSG